MNPLVLLAKKAIENYVKERKIVDIPNDLPEEFLKKKAGTFVSIFRSTRETDAKQEHETDAKELRGCIGTYLATRKNIAEEVIYNAIAAATEDYRFGPIREDELPYLSYTVYILSEPELVKNISELDPKKFGIIVKTIPIALSTGIDVVFNGHFVPKTGLLLPDLEGIDSIEQQISIACQKGGINPAKEKILIYKFTVEKYE
jgi:uncharacterized protein (TIGR00296 family)